MKPKTAVERSHHAKVAAMPCLVCGKHPVELHHVTALSDRRGRISKNHKRVTPLCSDHHRTGPMAVHRINHQNFYTEHGADLMAVAECLWSESNG